MHGKNRKNIFEHKQQGRECHIFLWVTSKTKNESNVLTRMSGNENEWATENKLQKWGSVERSFKCAFIELKVSNVSI